LPSTDQWAKRKVKERRIRDPACVLLMNSHLGDEHKAAHPSLHPSLSIPYTLYRINPCIPRPGEIDSALLGFTHFGACPAPPHPFGMSTFLISEPSPRSISHSMAGVRFPALTALADVVTISILHAKANDFALSPAFVVEQRFVCVCAACCIFLPVVCPSPDAYSHPALRRQQPRCFGRPYQGRWRSCSSSYLCLASISQGRTPRGSWCSG
jgi:hypothetical protein